MNTETREKIHGVARKDNGAEEHQKARIEYHTKSVYGVDKHYVSDAAVAHHVSTLTGQKTINHEHMEALKKLGHEVVHVPKN